MPIDVHVPGCPPRPEALAHGILRLRDKIQGNDREGWRERYDAVGTEEVLPSPQEGPAAGSDGGSLATIGPDVREAPPVPDAERP